CSPSPPASRATPWAWPRGPAPRPGSWPWRWPPCSPSGPSPWGCSSEQQGLLLGQLRRQEILLDGELGRGEPGDGHVRADLVGHEVHQVGGLVRVGQQVVHLVLVRLYAVGVVVSGVLPLAVGQRPDEVGLPHRTGGEG